ncbi:MULTISPECIES: VOC family protein [unclassified Rhodococcus (in: high G+C Gram-positive bacteria)]|uniref:VOC family protein n=1 Tax=unclassified Rhodococcus (in: high G+C Gram-positive bacteria) TaxID=192944 RepID=UPI00146C6F4F|nr:MULTISPECIES: VOC family protein [unclassified Rhodococcus (in: high G+C Gram-positive bacteria)]NMD95491.1 glyoxalase [Rhodococcus sp. BL-253-APC-6A1W]NME79486.1 glyoxalase [Rhodococcus sp. 105337]
MHARRITTNLHVSDVESAKDFYRDYLGLSTEEFDMGWVARYTDPDSGAHVQLVSGDATAPEDAVMSVHTDDVDAAYDEARQAGYEIVHPLTTEEWGVRRFLVRAPDGNVINVVRHRD